MFRDNNLSLAWTRLIDFSPSLAGDCVVCALWYPPDKPRVEGVKDSKQLTHKKRVKLFEEIQQRGALYAIVPATVRSINELGIYAARDLAAQTAVFELDRILERELGHKADRILVDGKYKMITDPRAEFIVRGDETEYIISCASIMAKVYFDALMEGYESFWPGYGMNKDHGSLSKKHKAALKTQGPSPVHRIGGAYAKQWAERLGIAARRA